MPWFRRRKVGPSVTVSDAELTVTESATRAATIRWADVREVRVRTTDTGPFTEDVFFVVRDSTLQLTIPHSHATEAFVERLQALAGFDNEALVRAMSSAENAEFICYLRS